MKNVSIVVPVYNEEKGVRDGVEALCIELQKLPTQWEIIIVNDGSTDGSRVVLEEVAEPRIKVLHHQSNRGYGAALKTGILSAQYGTILITDADLTYPVEPIPEILSAMSDNDTVVGARTGYFVKHSFIKRLAKSPIHWLANYLVDSKIPDLNSGLRAFDRDLAKKYMRVLSNRFSFTAGITLAFFSDGYRVRYLPINYYKRAGRSKVRPIADAFNYLRLVVQMILFYNPLKVFIPMSVLFFLLSVTALLYDLVVLKNFTEKSIILFTAFVQVTILGLLADLINKRAP